jgi:hypothetical protein
MLSSSAGTLAAGGRESNEAPKGWSSVRASDSKIGPWSSWCGEAKRSTRGAEGKPIVRSSRGTWCARHQSTSGYPKPADLCLGRVKRRETGVEARSRNDVQIFAGKAQI